MAAPRLDRIDRNLLINGNFDFWQRGVGPTQISAQGYLADRWSHTESLATGAATIERSTDVPNGQSLYSAKLTVTSAQASPAAGEISFFQQVIEGNFFREARGKDLTLSFYIKTSVTGTWFLSFRNGGVNRTLLKPFTVSVANTWTKILINFTHDETGTWLYDTGAGLRVGLTLAAGTSWHSVTTNAWENGQFYSTASGVNFFAVNGSTLFLSQMKLQIGEFDEVEFSTAGRDYAEELRLCQRYHYRLDHPFNFAGWQMTLGFITNPVTFPTEMRAIPVFSSSALTTIQAHSNGNFDGTMQAQGFAFGQMVSNSTSSSNNKTWMLQGTGPAVGPRNFNFYSNTAAAFLAWDAEL